MDFLYAFIVIEFAVMAGCLALLLKIFAGKVADMTFVKLMYGAMAITLCTVLCHLAFYRFLGMWVVGVDFLLIAAIVSKFYDISFVRALPVTLVFMLGAMGVQMGVEQYSSGQTTLNDNIDKQRRDTQKAAMNEIMNMADSPAFGGGLAEKLEAASEQSEPIIIKAGVKSLGQVMIEVKTYTLAMIGSTEGFGLPGGNRTSSKDDDLLAIVQQGGQVSENGQGRINITVDQAPEIDIPVAPALPASPVDESASDEFEALFAVEETDSLPPTAPPLSAAPPETSGVAETVEDVNTATTNSVPTITITRSDGSTTTSQFPSRTISLDTSSGQGQPKIKQGAMTSLVKIRIQSTNPNYEAPIIAVTATGSGRRGAYIFADNEFYGIGDIITVPSAQPTRWRLKRVGPTIVECEPLP